MARPREVSTPVPGRDTSRKNPHTDAQTESAPNHLELEGVVEDVFAGGRFKVALDAGPTVKATISGRMRRYHIRVLLGDRVRVALSPYDLTHGLVTFRELNRARHAA